VIINCILLIIKKNYEFSNSCHALQMNPRMSQIIEKHIDIVIKYEKMKQLIFIINNSEQYKQFKYHDIIHDINAMLC